MCLSTRYRRAPPANCSASAWPKAGARSLRRHHEDLRVRRRLDGQSGRGEARGGGSDQVTLIARGPHLAAMKQNGLTLISEGATDRHAAVLDRRSQRGRATGRRHSRGQGQRASCDRRRSRAAARPGDGRWCRSSTACPGGYLYKLPGPYENTRVESRRSWRPVLGAARAAARTSAAWSIRRPKSLRRASSSTRTRIVSTSASRMDRRASARNRSHRR